MVSTGGRKYRTKAEDFHLPNCIMVESGMPAWTAVVAAPMRKLWPLIKLTSGIVGLRACRSAVTRNSLDKGLPDLSKNSGPGVGGRTAR